MIKTYILTTPARNSSIILRGKTNNSMRYNFTGGDPLSNKAASIMLRSQYAQDLLEASDEFKNGYIKLIRTEKGGESEQQPVAEKPANMIKEDITSAEQLLEFVANELEKPYQRSDAALEYAKKLGYEFPNLEIKK